MQEHNREIMVYSCGGRCWSPACTWTTRRRHGEPLPHHLADKLAHQPAHSPQL